MPQDNPQQQITIEEWEEKVRDHFKIPKGLWKAIPSQESGGDWGATSPTGVRGKYQVTERTAKGYNLDRNDPYQQVVAAARTLKDNYDRLGTIKDDRARWLGATGRYYAGDDGVDAQGNLSTGSKDGVSNAATHVERVAKYWGDFERQAGGAGRGVSAPTLAQSNVADAAPIVPATSLQRRAKPGPIKTLSRGPVVTPEQRLTQNADPFSFQEASGFRSEAQKAYERTQGLGKGRPTGAKEVFNQAAQGLMGMAPQAIRGNAELLDVVIDAGGRIMSPQLTASILKPRQARATQIAKAAEPYAANAERNIQEIAPVDPNDKGFWTATVPQGVGSAAGFALGGLTGRAASLGRVAPGAMAGLLGMGVSAGAAAKEMNEAKVEGPRRNLGVLFAAGTGLTEMAGLGKMLDRFGLKQKFIERATSVLEEGGQEGLQQFLENVNAAYVGGQDPNRPLTKDVLMSALAGGVIGAGMQGVDVGVQTAADPRGAAEAIKGAVERVVDPKTAKLRRATARGLGQPAPDAPIGQDLRQKYAGAVQTSPIMETLRTLEPDAHFDIEEVLNRGLSETSGEDSDLRTIYQNAKQQRTVQEILSVMEPEQQADPEAAINRGLRAQAPGPDLRATYGNAPQQNTVQQILSVTDPASQADPATVINRGLRPQAPGPDLRNIYSQQAAGAPVQGILGARENLAAQQQAAEAQAAAAEIERQQREAAAAAQQAQLEQQANAPTAELPPPPVVSPAQQERNNRIRIARQVSVEAQAQAQAAEAAGDYAGALAGVEAARSAVDDLMKAMRKEGSAGAIKLRAQLKGEKAALDARVGNLRKLAKGAPAPRSGRPAAQGQAGALAMPATPQAPSAPLLNSIVNPEGGNPKSPTLPTDFGYLAAQQQRGQDNRLANMGILSRIRSLGGIRPGINAGELVNAREKRYPGLLNQNGIPADTLIEYLAEDGYPVDRNDLNTLWDAIDQAAAGKAVLPMDRQRDTRDLGGNGESYSEYLARTSGDTGALPETSDIPAPPAAEVAGPPRKKTERQRVPPRVSDEGIAALDARRAELSRLKYDRGGTLPDDLADEFRELGSVIYAYQNEMAGREENDYPPYVKAAPMTPRAKAEFEQFLADGRKMFDDLAAQAHLREEAEAYEAQVDAYLADPETEAEIRAALAEFEQNGIGPAVDLILSGNEDYELSERAREDLLEGLAAAAKLESDREGAPAPVVGRGEAERTVTDTERTTDSAAPARSADWRPNKSLEEFERMANAQLEEYRDWIDNQQRKEVTQGASDLDPASFVTQRTRLKAAWQKRWPKGEHSWSNWGREKPAPREAAPEPAAPQESPAPTSAPATAMQVRYESATRYWGDWSARAESDGETIRVLYEHEGEEYPYELPMAGFVGTGARAEEILTGSGVPLSKRATLGSTVRQYIANLGLDAAFEVRKQADREQAKDEPKAGAPIETEVQAESAVSLSSHFAGLFTSGRAFASITEARAEAAKFLGEDVKPGTAIAKTVDEAIEVAIVQSAREIIRQGNDPQAIYQNLVDLLGRQPNLNVRTSTSVAQQAYSTPAPLAYVASHLAGIGKYTTVYEPTAGNGMLLIAADPANVQANELNADRAAALKEQGFATASEDATTYTPPKRSDVVIANPPFGVVRDEQGNSKKYKVLSGYDTTEVDHAIAFQALAEGLKNNGKAVLIVGSVAKTAQSEKARADAYNRAAKRRFYYNLYRDYNVVDHFTVSGDMYSKQGAAWPVDVIVIHGQGQSSLPLPAVRAPRIYENYTQLAEVLGQPAGASSRVGLNEQPGSVSDPGRTGTGARSGRLPDLPSKPNREDGGRVGEPAGRGNDSAPATGGRGTTGRVGGPDVAGGDNQQSPLAGETSKPGRAAEERRKGGEGKPGSADSTQGNRPGGVAQPSGKINTAALNDLFNEALADVFGEDVTPLVAQPEVKPEPKPKPAPAKAKPAAPATPRPAKEAAKDAAKSGAKTMDEIAKGLSDLFGDPTRMSSGFTFDEKTYAKAKVHFQAAVEHFKDTAKSVNEVMRSLIQTLRDQYGFTADMLRKMQQYVVKFVQEYTAKPATTTQQEVTEKPAAKPAPAIAKDSETHRVYKPVSKARSVDTLVPINMATATEVSVSNLREQVGELHEYVADKLDYDPATIADYFSGEQLDALALAIHNIERGDGFIIGDQTGIGKGRIVAGVIRYAMKTGKTPIFVTEKPPLYGDMVRDLTDIGMAVQGATPPQTRSWPKVIRPLITNNGEAVPISDEAMEWAAEAEKAREAGKKAPPRPKSGFIETAAGPQHTALLNAVANRGMQGAGYDVVFTTYSQMQKKLGENAPRHIVLDRLAEGGVIILDESHNAGGGKPKTDKDGEIIEDRAIFVRKLARKASAVLYSSATYAKRPEVMDLYFKTDLGKAVADIATLPDVINRGGIPLQQVVASMLSKAGQYMRRERSFQGVEYNVTTSEVNREAAEQVATVFRGIIAFQGLRQAAVENIEDGLRGAGGTLGKDQAISAESSNFTAIIHNVIDQMLLNLKAAPAADLAIESLKRGEKPIITVSNTMGAFLEQFAEENGINPGDPLGVDFGGVLQRYLERMRRVTIKKGNNEKEHHYLTDDELSPQAVETYYAVERMIRETDFSDMFISPIDRIHQRLRDAGYKTAEITGRNQIVDYSGQLPVYRTRPGAERSTIGKKRAIAGFNDGSIDCLIINQSGSTGISLHASEKFKDQRRRHMIIAQAEKNVDTHMQMLGRVHRTGQVVPPRYTQLSADVPAEKRPAAVLAKKMASLNANTTASRGSAVTAKDVVDFLNKYGDQVAFTVMEANPALHAALGSPAMENDQGKPAEDAMRRLTGRIPILPLAEQEALYSLLESEYLDLVAREEAMGTNTLEAKTLALDAETISKDVLSAARGGASPFTQESYIERVRVKRLGKPMTAAQVTQLVQEATRETGTLDELKEKGLQGTQKIISGIREETAAIVKDQQEQADAQIAGFDKIIERSDDPAAVSKAQKARDAAVLRKTNAKLQAEKDWNTWAAIAKTVHPGNSVAFSAENGVFYGIVTKLERKDKEGNPIARGKWRVTIALADAARSITLPLSQITVEGLNEADKVEVRFEDAMPNYNAETGMIEYIPIVDAFDAGQSESTEVRNVVTGNILAGFAEVKGKGQITNYTDKDGNVQQGILMPKNWDREKELKSRDVIFETADQILEFVRGGNKVKSRDGNLTISTDMRGRLQLVTPKAKAKGGPYFTNAKILATIGKDFVSAGSQMRAEVSEDQLRRVVTVLQTDGISGSAVGLLADGAQEKARAIVEGKTKKDDAPAFNLRSGGGGASLFDRKPRVRGSADKPQFVLDAEVRLRDAMTGKAAGSGARQMADLAIVTGYKAYRAGMDFAEWSAAVIREHGERIKPHLEAAWNRLSRLTPQQIKDPVSYDLMGETDAAHRARPVLSAAARKDAMQWAKVQPRSERGAAGSSTTGFSQFVAEIRKTPSSDGEAVDRLIDRAIEEFPDEWDRAVELALRNDIGTAYDDARQMYETVDSYNVLINDIALQELGNISEKAGRLGTTQIPAFNLRQDGGGASLFDRKQPDVDLLREQSEMEADLAREELAKVDARLTAINREIDMARGAKETRGEKKETRAERAEDARLIQKLRQEQRRLSREYDRLEEMAAAADERTAEYQAAAQNEQWRRASADRRRALLANNWTERGYEQQRNGNWTREGFPTLTKADFENALNDDAAMARTEAPELARDEKGRFAANNYWRTPMPTKEPQTEEEAEEFVGHARSEFRQRSEGPGTLWINRQSATVIASAMKQLGRKVQSFAGVAVHVDQVRDIVQFLDQRVEAYANGQRIADLVRDLEDAIADAEAHGYDRVAIVDPSYSTLAFNKSTTREERFHRWQSIAGIFSDNIGRGLHEALKDDPVYTFMRDQLIAEGYAANDGRLLVSEASAKIASGQWREYGLESEQQGMDFLFRYMHAAYRTVGRQLFTDTIPGTARAKEIYQDVQEFAGETRPGGGISRIAEGRQGARDAGVTPASVRRGDPEGAGGGRGGRSEGVPRSERRRSGDIGSLRGITLESLRGEQAPATPRAPRAPQSPRPATTSPSRPAPRPADLRSITSESMGLPTPPARDRRANAPRTRAEAPREPRETTPADQGSMRERAFTTIGGLQAGVQLGSPGFVGRNILQHIGYAVQSGMADRVAQIVDAAFSTVTRRPRSVVVPGDPVSNSLRGVKNYIRGVKDAYARHKAGEQIDGGSVEEVRNMPTNRVAQAVRSVLVYINEIPDAGNYAARLDRRMRILTATANRNGVAMDEETMAAIVAQAELEAAHDSMRDENFVSVSLKKLKEGLNATTSPITGTTRFGIGDFIVKYTQTPGALLKRGIEYSPFGLIEAAMHAGRATMGRGGEYETRMAMQALGRSLSGTASTMGLGAVLAAMGALVEPEKEDFTSEDLERERGVRGFSINLSALARIVPAMLGGGSEEAGKLQPGDKLVPIDWAQPWAMGASVGASMYNQVKQGKFSTGTTAGAAARSFENMMDVMGDQSVLKNLREYIRAAKGRTFGEQAQNVAEKFLKGVPQSFAPSLTRQAGNVVDPKMRDYRPEERGGIKAALQEGSRRAMAGTLPGLSRRYPEKVSAITGEPRKTAQGELSLGGRLLNLLSPVIVNEYKADGLRDEIIRLNTLLEERDVSLFVPPLTEQQTKKPGYKEPTSLLREREGKFARSFAEQGHKLVTAHAFRSLSDAAKADAIRDLAAGLRAATYKKEQADSVGKIIQGSQKAARPARAKRENQNLLPQYR